MSNTSRRKGGVGMERPKLMTEERALTLKHLLAGAKRRLNFDARTDAEKAFAAADVEALTAACHDLGLIDDYVAFEVNGLAQPGDQDAPVN